MTEQHEHEVEVVVDLQASELIRANLWFIFSQRSTVFTIAAAIGITFLGSAVLYMLRGELGWYIVLPIAAVVLPAAFPFFVVIEALRTHPNAKDFQKQIHYSFYGDHYDVSDGKSSARISWESVLKAVESRDSFNLFMGRTLFVVIPKRCFKAAVDIETLKSILRAALGEKTKLLTN
ncbi:MAG TPA: YcxB family protein [Pyrinomonadaceae bacterium]|nr:YcxB family protein [Pyrinomonadaceae bacterium]